MFFSCFLSQIITFFTGFFSISTFLHVHIFLHRKKRVLFSVSSQCRLSSFVIFYCGCEKISIVFFTIYVVVCFCLLFFFFLILLLFLTSKCCIPKFYCLFYVYQFLFSWLQINSLSLFSLSAFIFSL